MGLLFQVSTLCPSRRSEICALRWSDWDDEEATFDVHHVLLQLGGKLVHKDRPKNKGSNRLLFLDAETAGLVRDHRKAQLRARMKAGPDWQDNDLVFCQPDGSPWHPDLVTKRFKRLCGKAGVPVIKYHEGGRHTENSLNYDAEVREDVALREGGWTNRKTGQRYNHPLRQAHREAAEKRAALVRKAAGAR